MVAHAVAQPANFVAPRKGISEQGGCIVLASRLDCLGGPFLHPTAARCRARMFRFFPSATPCVPCGHSGEKKEKTWGGREEWRPGTLFCQRLVCPRGRRVEARGRHTAAPGSPRASRMVADDSPSRVAGMERTPLYPVGVRGLPEQPAPCPPDTTAHNLIAGTCRGSSLPEQASLHTPPVDEGERRGGG